VDLLGVSPADVERPAPLPFGRLREPLRIARLAHAALVPDVDDAQAEEMARRLGIARAFRVARRLGPAQRLDTFAAAVSQEPAGLRALAVAGIARPRRFFDDLRATGWDVAGERTFPDHHRYTAGDVAAIAQSARACGAGIVITTEKDVLRLLPFRPLPFAAPWLPLAVSIGPAAVFRQWLQERLRGQAAEAVDPLEAP
jgi:tetraacyldisaccharide 4'-kinase